MVQEKIPLVEKLGLKNMSDKTENNLRVGPNNFGLQNSI